MNNFTIDSTVKKYPTDNPYQAIKEKILGKRYNLSLVFVGEDRAKSINQQNRGKAYSPNVLSFPLTETVGEIYICPNVARREAKSFNRTLDNQVAFLFIHGLLHLKGYDHGDTMDKLEQKYLKAFALS